MFNNNTDPIPLLETTGKSDISPIYRFYCRCFQLVMRLAAYTLPWRKPILLSGPGCLAKLPSLLAGEKSKQVLIVTDATLVKLDLLSGLLAGLEKQKIAFVVYDKTETNPTIDHIEEARALYLANHCDSIVAFGGGSPIDCAKGVGARVVRPHKPIPKMKGLLKIRRRLPPLFAVPTTAGTGSEATIAAVITDSKIHEKYPINDLCLVPRYAVLDPLLTLNLPKNITATTGMDTLTHAVEAYIGGSNTRETRELARKTVAMVFGNLVTATTTPQDLTARTKMQMASYYGGLAFTRAYVGYVHAMAHALGGLYDTPHGLANAVILPYVLLYFGPAVEKPLAELADVVGLAGQTTGEKATAFIQAIRCLNQQMDIPKKLAGIDPAQIPLLADRAVHEANPFYPVPRILSQSDLIYLFHQISE